MINPKYILISLIIFTIINSTAFSQDGSLNSFKQLSFPEKRWVIFHPFIAKKTLIISLEAKQQSKNLETDTILDQDPAGGQVDAFRHCYWMARLSQEFKSKKAYKLGIAHEKGNYLDFKNNKNEDGHLPDSISSKMDLLNNDVGINIGIENNNLSNEELIQLIIKSINQGKLFIIRKDKKGNFLDCKGNLIELDELLISWTNKKCIVQSNVINKF